MPAHPDSDQIHLTQAKAARRRLPDNAPIMTTTLDALLTAADTALRSARRRMQHGHGQPR
jgi:hypothetical protein